MEDRVHVKPPVSRPKMEKGTLLKTFRKATHVYITPERNPKTRGSKHLAKVGKDEVLMSLGEFRGEGSKTWIHVVTSSGPGWVQVKDISPSETPQNTRPTMVVLTLDEAKALRAVVLGDSFDSKVINSVLTKIGAVCDE